jgi:copper oxidase (laccase) domain-containing protein
VASVIAPRHDLEADGLATGHPNIAVAVLVADCVPIALADDTGRVCVVHAGWRGLAAGVVQAAIDQFDEPWHVKAFVGPRVSPAVYQVGPEVAATFANVRGAVLPDEGDRSRLDLVMVALEALQRAAVLDDNVAVCDNVTDGGATFFSDRAQRPCGRVGLVLRPTTYDGRVRSQR